MEEDKTALLAAMYQDDDDQPSDTPVDQPGFNRSRKIRIGIVEYEVPTVEYVTRLEQVVMRQQHMIDQQRRLLARVQSSLSATRNAVRRQAITVHEVSNQLGRTSIFE